MKFPSRNSSLKWRMILGVSAVLLPLLVMVTALFAQTIHTEQAAAQEKLRVLTRQISASIDEVAVGAYNASDNLAENDILLDKVDRKYEDHLVKKAVILQVNGQVFESYNRLVGYEKMDAMYVRGVDEIYDFLDPNQDEAVVRQGINELGMNDKDKMGWFHWYPLQNNFLTTTVYDVPRRDSVVLGSRRIFSILHSEYQYLHVFAIEEQTFYDAYAEQAAGVNAVVYVLDENGGLISSTQEDAVFRQQAPAEIIELQTQPENSVFPWENQNQKYYVSHTKSELTDWDVIAFVPQDTMVAATTALYQKVMGMLVISVSLCGLILWHLYRRFVEPLSELDASMKRVEQGDFEAYVIPRGEAELVKMMKRYNKMLRGIRQRTDQQLEMERTKKELEMQVLTNQINPHFLYNTLETIVWKSSEAGRPDIGRIASALGKLYRLSIRGGTFVQLSQELEHLQAYISIQETRYGGKVTHQIRLRDVDPEACRILKLTLQPLVENCYLYATEGLDRRLKIRVEARRKNGRLQIRVVDNGVGMSRERLEQVRHQMITGARPSTTGKMRVSTGIGLHNIYARIKMYEQGGTMHIISKKDWGTVMIMEIPMEQL